MPTPPASHQGSGCHHRADFPNLVNGLLLHCWSCQTLSPQNNIKNFFEMWICTGWHSSLIYLCLSPSDEVQTPYSHSWLDSVILPNILSYYSLKYLQPSGNALILSGGTDPFSLASATRSAGQMQPHIISPLVLQASAPLSPHLRGYLGPSNEVHAILVTP